MSFKVKLEFNGVEYNVLGVEYGSYQATDAAGRPSSVVRAGKITVSVESTGSSDLLAAATDSFFRGDGKITFLKRDSNATLKEIIFKDAYIVEYTESFTGGGVIGANKFDNASDENPATETVVFSAQTIQKGEVEFSNDWPSLT
ncbi:type VI secretion system tube protein TssD (plasmid) [Bernardetia sp. Wsw4-3y2]|uniref:type VI secretion system tube protein TssD n=1 Tax=Bernardetia sp. Wsw4-3y2 TaxID=3127471 RepID=UPI0030D2AC6B